MADLIVYEYGALASVYGSTLALADLGSYVQAQTIEIGAAAQVTLAARTRFILLEPAATCYVRLGGEATAASQKLVASTGNADMVGFGAQGGQVLSCYDGVS